MFYLVVENRLRIVYSLYYLYFILLHIDILAISHCILKKVRNNIIARGQKNVLNRYVDI